MPGRESALKKPESTVVDSTVVATKLKDICKHCGVERERAISTLYNHYVSRDEVPLASNANYLMQTESCDHRCDHFQHHVIILVIIM